MITDYLTRTPRDWFRLNTVGASEIGGCARQVSYLKHETPPDNEAADGWGFMERGHWVEAWAVGRMIANNAPVEQIGDDQVTYSDGFLSATPDGWHVPSETSFDVKSFDPRTEVLALPMPKHVLQVRIGARLNPKTEQGSAIYVNASDFEDQIEYGPWPALTDDELKSLKTAARDIITKDPESFPRHGFAMGECGRCPFHQRCLGEPWEGKGRLTGEQIGELQKHREAYREAQRSEAEASHRKRQAQENVRALFKKADVTVVKGMASISRETVTIR